MADPSVQCHVRGGGEGRDGVGGEEHKEVRPVLPIPIDSGWTAQENDLFENMKVCPTTDSLISEPKIVCLCTLIVPCVIDPRIEYE